MPSSWKLLVVLGCLCLPVVIGGCSGGAATPEQGTEAPSGDDPEAP
ncbi:MAG: hypothetical protein H6822_01720 [Planctomycetaceae bacterium]|nr:hypothetical protein [Planctomycetales bacterium]MCB9920866.1 hypothetical protein [Planctomycetaceae bacterium]